jgi:hypothetical protein
MAKLETPEFSTCTECEGKIVKRHENVPFFHLASGAIRCDRSYTEDATSVATPR